MSDVALKKLQNEELFGILYGKYYDYNSFRTFLLECVVNDVSWNIMETNPLSKWMKRVALSHHNSNLNDKEIYVSFEGARLYILDKTYDPPAWVEFEGLRWHKVFLNSLIELDKEQVTAKEAVCILDKVIALDEEIKKLKNNTKQSTL